MTELKPCPFCGNSSVDYTCNIDMEPDGIRCRSCQIVVRFPRIRVKSNKEPFGVVMGKMEEIWNRRDGEKE